MSISKPTLDDLKLFVYIHSQLSDYEFSTYIKFIKEHESLSFDEQINLLHDEFPELFEKLIIIGGNLNGCK